MKVVDESNIYKKGSLEDLPLERPRVLHSSDLLPKIISQRHIAGGFIIFRGLIADRPSDGGTHKQIWFSTDENKLYFWNPTSESWVSAALT